MASDTPTLFGVMHSRAEIMFTCSARSINVTISFIPWRDDVLIFNYTSHPLVVESVPNRLDKFEIAPRQHAVVYPGSWQLRDHETTINFLLRPRRYLVLLKDAAKKRSAPELTPSDRDSKQLTGPDVVETSETSSDPSQKVIIRPTIIDADTLTRLGLRDNQTLNMVDTVTGQLEYSIRYIDHHLRSSSHCKIFKAIWDDKSSEPAIVAVKLHKIETADPSRISGAIGRWKQEVWAHKSLKHVGRQFRGRSCAQLS